MYLICGETLYDVFIDPLAIDAVRKITLSAKAGGSPHNVAIGLARLGCAVSLGTEIAADSLGRLLESHLLAEGVNCQFVRRTAKATPLAMVDVDPKGVPRYAFHGLDAMLFHPELGAVQKQWSSLYGVHLGSIPIVSAQSGEKLLELIGTAPDRVMVSFDPNVRLNIEPDVERWRTAVEKIRALAHLIKVSEEDIGNLFGSIDLDGLAERWLTHRCSLVVITRGARGAVLYSRKAGRIEVPAVSVVVADTVGAGDSFQAAMLAWLAEARHASPNELAALDARQVRDMGRFATHAAAITCRHRGPEFPYRKALKELNP
jgi:fructokinase